MNKKAISGLTMLALAVIVLLPWTVRSAERIYHTFRLLVQGEVVQANVTHATTRFTESWPYRLEYHFEVGTATYEEPVHNGFRSHDIGAPVPKTLWKQAEKTGAISVLHLFADPAINMPADWGVWLLLDYFYQVGTVLFRVFILVSVVLATIKQLGSDKSRVEKEIKSWGGTLAIGFIGWLFLEWLLRVIHLAIGISDMDLLDVMVSILPILPLTVVPLGLTMAVLKAKVID